MIDTIAIERRNKAFFGRSLRAFILLLIVHWFLLFVCVPIALLFSAKSAIIALGFSVVVVDVLVLVSFGAMIVAAFLLVEHILVTDHD